jgi:hypothetical protein
VGTGLGGGGASALVVGGPPHTATHNARTDLAWVPSSWAYTVLQPALRALTDASSSRKLCMQVPRQHVRWAPLGGSWAVGTADTFVHAPRLQASVCELLLMEMETQNTSAQPPQTEHATLHPTFGHACRYQACGRRRVPTASRSENSPIKSRAMRRPSASSSDRSCLRDSTVFLWV